MFCPFIKDTCNPECVFCYNDVDSPDYCAIYEATQTLGKLQDSTDKLEKLLSSIDYNTSSDQTSSSDISDTLDEIKGCLKQVSQKI